MTISGTKYTCKLNRIANKIGKPVKRYLYDEIIAQIANTCTAVAVVRVNHLWQCILASENRTQRNRRTVDF